MGNSEYVKANTVRVYLFVVIVGSQVRYFGQTSNDEVVTFGNTPKYCTHALTVLSSFATLNLYIKFALCSRPDQLIAHAHIHTFIMAEIIIITDCVQTIENKQLTIR